MQRWRSLRVRLTLWIILATVIPFAALMRLAVHFKGEAVVAVALGDLSRLARTKSDSIDNWLAARRAELASLSRDSSNEHQVSDETARRLQRLDSDRPSFAGIVAIGPDGTVVSSRPRTAADAGETTASLLDAAKRNPDGFSVTPTPGSSADAIALLAIRWPHHGRAQGVLAARLDGLEALLAGKAPGKARGFLLMDATEGSFVGGSPSLLSGQVGETARRALLDALRLSRKRGANHYASRDADIVAAWEWLQEPGWALVAVKPAQQVRAPVRRMAMWLWAGLTALVGTALLLSPRVAAGLLRPLQEIKGSLEHVA